MQHPHPTWRLQPGDTHTIRGADIAVKLTVRLGDGSEFETIMIPNQSIRLVCGRSDMAIVVEDAE